MGSPGECDGSEKGISVSETTISKEVSARVSLRVDIAVSPVPDSILQAVPMDRKLLRLSRKKKSHGGPGYHEGDSSAQDPTDMRIEQDATVEEPTPRSDTSLEMFAVEEHTPARVQGQLLSPAQTESNPSSAAPGTPHLLSNFERSGSTVASSPPTYDPASLPHCQRADIQPAIQKPAETKLEQAQIDYLLARSGWFKSQDLEKQMKKKMKKERKAKKAAQRVSEKNRAKLSQVKVQIKAQEKEYEDKFDQLRAELELVKAQAQEGGARCEKLLNDLDQSNAQLEEYGRRCEQLMTELDQTKARKQELTDGYAKLKADTFYYRWTCEKAAYLANKAGAAAVTSALRGGGNAFSKYAVGLVWSA